MKYRILIVEDESIVALDIQTRLEAHGFEVIDIVSTGSRAIEKAVDQNPDLILMDINLKGSIDGVETASLIRRQIDSPIVFLTAFADEKTMKKARISDASGYILKPFRESELLVTIELAIKRSIVRKKIQENSNWLYSTLNFMNDAVITVSEEKRVVFLNRKAEELMDNELAIGSVFNDEDYIITDNQRLRFRKGDKNLDIEHSQTDIFDEENTRLGQVHVIHDISKQVAYEIGLEKARAAAEDSNRAKSDFLANITHELRTPLNTIMGMNSIVSELTADEELSEMHDLIGKAADSLLKQVNELLELSEIERGEIGIKAHRFAVRPLIEEVVSTFRAQADVKSVELYIECGDIPFLSADKNRIRDIVSCIMSNAVKFTRKGSVTVTVLYEEGMLKMAFRDTGIGLSDEQKEKVFNLFTQGDGSRTRFFGGVGVGLTLVNKLVTMLGGKMEVQSRISEGSTFSVAIPAEISTDQDSVEEPAGIPEAVESKGSSIEDMMALYRQVAEYFGKKDFKTCNRLIREFRESNQIVELNWESQILFKLSAAVKLKSSDKMDMIKKEIADGSVISSGGIYENSYS